MKNFKLNIIKLNVITAILTSICISCAPFGNVNPNKLKNPITSKNLKKQKLSNHSRNLKKQTVTPIQKIQQKITKILKMNLKIQNLQIKILKKKLQSQN